MITFVCKDGTLECDAELVQRHFHIHIIDMDMQGSISIDVTKNLDRKSCDQLLALLRLQDSATTNEIEDMTDVVQTFKPAQSCSALICLFRVAHFLGVSQATKLLAKLVFKCHVQNKSAREIADEFDPFFPCLESEEKETRDVLVLLNEDQTAELLSHWYPSTIWSIKQLEGTMRIKEFLIRTEDFIESIAPIDIKIRYCIEHSRNAVDQNQVKSSVEGILGKVAELPQNYVFTSSVKILCYHAVYSAVTGGQKGITKEQIIEMARLHLRSLLRQGIPSSVEEVCDSCSYVVALASAWARVRCCAARFAFICAYTCKKQSEEPEAAAAPAPPPWDGAQLRSMLRSEADHIWPILETAARTSVVSKGNAKQEEEVRQLLADVQVTLRGVAAEGGSGSVAFDMDELLLELGVVTLVSVDGVCIPVQARLLSSSSVLMGILGDALALDRRGSGGMVEVSLPDRSCTGQGLRTLIRFLEAGPEGGDHPTDVQALIKEIDDETLFNLILVCSRAVCSLLSVFVLIGRADEPAISHSVVDEEVMPKGLGKSAFKGALWDLSNYYEYDSKGNGQWLCYGINRAELEVLHEFLLADVKLPWYPAYD